MTATKIYQHPDGHEIVIGNNLLTVTTDEGEALSIPIGTDGCTVLGKELLELAATQNQMEAEGAELGANLVQTLIDLRYQGQAAAFCALRQALMELAEMEHPTHAIGGFAGQIVNVLEIGIDNLPKGKL